MQTKKTNNNYQKNTLSHIAKVVVNNKSYLKKENSQAKKLNKLIEKYKTNMQNVPNIKESQVYAGPSYFGKTKDVVYRLYNQRTKNIVKQKLHHNQKPSANAIR